MEMINTLFFFIFMISILFFLKEITIFSFRFFGEGKYEISDYRKIALLLSVSYILTYILHGIKV